MEHAAFRPPLNDVGLAQLGRATYNWAMADLIAGTLLKFITRTPLDRELIDPLMIEKKAQILKKRLDCFPEGECRNLVESFSKTIVRLNEGRNHAIHGFWGWEHRKGEEPRAAAYSHKLADPLLADNISTLADEMAVATRQGHTAMTLLSGGTAPTNYPVNFWFGNTLPPVQPKVQPK